METRKLGEGLWYWTAPHPDWKPKSGGKGGWEQTVGCVYYEAPDAVVLFDPLAPPDGTADAAEFWSALDRDVERAKRPVAVLLTNHYHQRSSAKVVERYPGTLVHGSKHLAGKTVRPVDRTFDDGDVLPGGVKARGVRGMEEDETAFYIPHTRRSCSGTRSSGSATAPCASSRASGRRRATRPGSATRPSSAPRSASC
jgi:hypothetical protein